MRERCSMSSSKKSKAAKSRLHDARRHDAIVRVVDSNVLQVLLCYSGCHVREP